MQTRRPIPVQCTTDEEATAMELRFKEFGGETWKSAEDEEARRLLPGGDPLRRHDERRNSCASTCAPRMPAATVDSWGSKKIPVEIASPKNRRRAAVLSGRGPARALRGAGDVPAGLPRLRPSGVQRGDKDWGAQLHQLLRVQAGPDVHERHVRNRAELRRRRRLRRRQMRRRHVRRGGRGRRRPAGPYKKNWIGIHVAHDIAIVGGDDVCSNDSQSNKGFACFYSGTDVQYQRDPQPGIANRIATGFSPPGASTTRFMLSFDRAFTPNIMIGARAGYAIGGGPPPTGGASFLPIHAELRGSYWFGRDALAKKGLRPYVFVGGGMAQVDSKLEVTIRDCSEFRPIDALGNPAGPPHPADQNTYAACARGQGPPPGEEAVDKTLDAYKKLGQGFAAAGGGAVYALNPKMGIQLNLNIMFMLPSSGQVFEPSLGFVMGL